MHEMRFISFGEVVKDRDAYVPVTEDGLLYAVSLVMVMTGKNRDDAGKVLRRLTEDVFDADKYTERQSDKGGRPTKLLTLQNAIELVMVLPGKIAKDARKQFADIITRYKAGDQSIIVETNCNAISNDQIAELSRSFVAKAKETQVEKKRTFSAVEIEANPENLNQQLVLYTKLDVVLKSFNEKRRDEVKIKKEEADIEIKNLREKAEIEIKTRESNLALEEKEKKLALDTRREELALRKEEIELDERQKTLPMKSKIQTGYMSIREIYLKHSDKFPMEKTLVDDFVMKAGGKAASLYRIKNNQEQPEKTPWNVCIYATKDENLAIEAMTLVYKQPKYQQRAAASP